MRIAVTLTMLAAVAYAAYVVYWQVTVRRRVRREDCIVTERVRATWADIETTTGPHVAHNRRAEDRRRDEQRQGDRRRGQDRRRSDQP